MNDIRWVRGYDTAEKYEFDNRKAEVIACLIDSNFKTSIYVNIKEIYRTTGHLTQN